MTDVMIKIGWALLTKVLTEAFVSRVLVHGARAVAKSTINKVDDQLVTDLAAALGVAES